VTCRSSLHSRTGSCWRGSRASARSWRKPNGQVWTSRRRAIRTPLKKRGRRRRSSACPCSSSPSIRSVSSNAFAGRRFGARPSTRSRTRSSRPVSSRRWCRSSFRAATRPSTPSAATSRATGGRWVCSRDGSSCRRRAGSARAASARPCGCRRLLTPHSTCSSHSGTTDSPRSSSSATPSTDVSS
jgi:hypothetical protein